VSLLDRLFGAGRRGERDADERWVVVDTETAGLDASRDALLAIGGVAVGADGIRIDDSFEVTLRNETHADASNIVIHGIGREAQRAGVPAREALAAFDRWVGGAPLVGFHSDFDRDVLRRAFREAGMEKAGERWLDLARLGAALVPGSATQRGRSLDDWLALFHIVVDDRHNAAGDALATAELLLRLREIARAQGAAGFAALARAADHDRWLGRGR
jgi:DNA polymerase-3 subunit epsilon